MIDLQELAFSEADHIYRLNGVIIPSVSKIIEPVSNAAYGTINPVVLQNAADRGTTVHKAIEDYNNYGIMDIEKNLSGYADAYTNWYEMRMPEVEQCEVRIYHKVMRYGGMADLLARIDGKRWLIDYKTSYKVVDKTYRLQLEAYVQALASLGVQVDEKMVLHLTRDGGFEEVFYPIKDAEAWRVFGACKSIYDYNNK